jgi:hypothetical protein
MKEFPSMQQPESGKPTTEESGVQKIASFDEEYLSSPEHKQRLVVGATKRILSILKEEQELVENILEIKKRQKMNFVELDDPKLEATQSELEKKYNKEFLRISSRGSAIDTTTSWEERHDRVESSVTKQKQILDRGLAELKRMKEAKNALVQKSASSR